MSVVRYPTAISPIKNQGVQDRHTHRGMRLEADINDTNAYYRECDKALIYKKPTPVQVVHVDYPARNKAKIVEAYYKTPSTTDYNGVYRGRYIDFEAKETKNKLQFPIGIVHPHQIQHLKKVQLHGGIGFFIVRFTSYNETYLIDAPLMIQAIERTTRSSISYSWFQKNGHQIQEGYIPRLDYLRIVDQIYFKEENS
ncbi:MAG TPA: Holliday junction resolvase RecU [Candidatus Faecalicoccus intestinipullorum]|nr:Holliday junction resolvase RecU [Candidatus Faecalicoccus intestinipullorum]